MLTTLAYAQTPAPSRPIALDDLARLEEVGSPAVSPDGKWVLCTVSSQSTAPAPENDRTVSVLWMISWDGAEQVRLTWGNESVSAPRFSPDGKYISFTSSRPGPAKGNQVWVLNRLGGEAEQWTNVKSSLDGYEWSPDGHRLLLQLREKDQPDTEPGKPAPPPMPIVLDRYHFKQDREGYLTDKARDQLYLFDIGTKKLEKLTSGATFNEEDPAWSPDGHSIAFVSNHDADPDRSENDDVFVVEAQPNSTTRKLTTFPGPDGGHLAWSPDSKSIAYTQASEPKLSAYEQNKAALVTLDGNVTLLSPQLDRNASRPCFAADGASITYLIADDRSQYPAAIGAAGGEAKRLTSDAGAASALACGAGHAVVVWTTDTQPSELYALEGDRLRQLTHFNGALVAQLKLAKTTDVTSKSKDGTEVHSLLTLPLNYQARTKVPLLLRIHGGPNGQDAHGFNFERQFFAAHGYAVLNVNYRGSNGRGQEYQRAIFDAWGQKEVMDLLGAVDGVIASGIADPARLGVGGWSYGGILTDYTIATDGRFKAAISGAGSANQLSMYGVDQYVVQYENEIGPPWKNLQAWIKLSYPFFEADKRIHTPTLFMGGDKDFNVPVAGGEQMYEALKSLGIPTEMVIYPGQFHGLSQPSFIRDRYERYLAWYDKYLAGSAQSATK